jgi:hypothetical protein
MMVALFFGGLIVIWLLWNAYIFWRIRQDYHAELAEFTELLDRVYRVARDGRE